VIIPQKKTLVCEICGAAGARLRRVTRSYGSGASLLVIENVPVVSCPHCGESYLSADTLHELDRLKAHRRSLASRRQVPVLAFAS
jgi:YgiT-type zinc finger domain-containing protein